MKPASHDGSKPELPSDLHPVLTAVYVPLVAVLLPEWLRVISRRQHLEGTPPQNPANKSG